METILTVNAGSSSLKFQVFSVGEGRDLTRILKGQIDGIGLRPRLRAVGTDGTPLIDRSYTSNQVPDSAAAMNETAGWLRETQQGNLVAVGHRVVHGGMDYSQPILIDPQVLDRLEQFVSLAPLHQPHNLAPIRAVLARRPELPQVACFDTAFHRGHGAVADHFAIPEEFYADGIRRYGFHGLSYEYVSGRLRVIAPDIADKRLIVAHLGSGASMCALLGGRSVETTMGFTALDGLPMGTRPGQIDPGVILHLIDKKGMSVADVQNMLYRDCGLKGLSGLSNDMRELQRSNDPRAAFAIDYFVYRVSLFSGMLAAALGGLDAFIFTAGIGENSPEIRAHISGKLGWLGARLDDDANAAGSVLISQPDSGLPIYVIPTDEELMIGLHTLSVLAHHRGQTAA